MARASSFAAQVRATARADCGAPRLAAAAPTTPAVEMPCPRYLAGDRACDADRRSKQRSPADGRQARPCREFARHARSDLLRSIARRPRYLRSRSRTRRGRLMQRAGRRSMFERSRSELFDRHRVRAVDAETSQVAWMPPHRNGLPIHIPYRESLRLSIGPCRSFRVIAARAIVLHTLWALCRRGA